MCCWYCTWICCWNCTFWCCLNYACWSCLNCMFLSYSNFTCSCCWNSHKQKHCIWLPFVQAIDWQWRKCNTIFTTFLFFSLFGTKFFRDKTFLGPLCFWRNIFFYQKFCLSKFCFKYKAFNTHMFWDREREIERGFLFQTVMQLIIIHCIHFCQAQPSSIQLQLQLQLQLEFTLALIL